VNQDQRGVIMTDEQLIELSSFIGNVIRLAAAVEPGDATAACNAATCAALHAVLLEPRQSPTTSHDHLVNRKLLQAFSTFRREIEQIQEFSRESPIERSVTKRGRSYPREP
jgi:hypothetical protein